MMPSPKTIVFVRHARYVGNEQTRKERLRAKTSTNFEPLSAAGLKQIPHTKAWLQSNYPSPDAILTSYYDRSWQTAEICYPDQPKQEEPLLAEINRGIWNVLSTEEMEKQFPFEITRQEREGYYHYRPIGGENWPDVEQRVCLLRIKLGDRFAGKTVILFGHANWWLCFEKVRLGFKATELIQRYKQNQAIENAAVAVYHGETDNGRAILKHEPEKDYIIPWQNKL